MKTCCHCKVEKPESEFHKDKSRKDGLANRCKDCVAIGHKRLDIDKTHIEDGTLRCTRCKKWLPPSDFYRNTHTKRGYGCYCKQCAKQKGEEYAVTHPYKPKGKRVLPVVLYDGDTPTAIECTRCKVVKPIDQFSPSKSARAGHIKKCKPCINAISAEKRLLCKNNPIRLAPIEKVCKKCGLEKLISEFEKCDSGKDGHRNTCSQCRRDEWKEKHPRTRFTARELGHKVCRRCNVDKPISEFRKHKDGGVQSWCKACSAAHQSVYAKGRRDKARIENAGKKAYRKPKMYSACPLCYRKNDGNVCPKCKAKKDREELRAQRLQQKEEDRIAKLSRVNHCPKCGVQIPLRSKMCKSCSYAERIERKKERYATDEQYRNGILSRASKYPKENRDKINEKEREYRKTHPDLVRHQERMKEHRERGVVGSHTVEEWNTVVDMCGHVCLKCGRPDTEVELTEDHIKPVIKGGTGYIWNIQCLCRSDNSAKGSREIDYRPQDVRERFCKPSDIADLNLP